MQRIDRRDGRRSFTIVRPTGEVHRLADGFLRQCRGGTDRTYAYLLVDHLRWLDFEGLSAQVVQMQDLRRYMAAVGAEFTGPYGQPWRSGKRVYGPSTLSTAAACVKGFYVFQGSQGIHQDLAAEFSQTRLPTRADRQRSFLGHIRRDLPTNPLTPTGVVRRRHPKMPPEGARDRLVHTASTARDRMAVTWLADGGFRIGELCGLHLIDLHLRESAGCGECRTPHVHICHRETNRNGARAKTKHSWEIESGTVRGGLIRRVSPAMIHTYFAYMTTEYPNDAAHGMLLVQLHGANAGQPWAAAGLRGVLRRAGQREQMGVIRPHSFRHGFATGVLEASGGDIVLTRDAGGWASATVVDQIYSHVDVDDPVLSAALSHVWSER